MFPSFASALIYEPIHYRGTRRDPGLILGFNFHLMHHPVLPLLSEGGLAELLDEDRDGVVLHNSPVCPDKYREVTNPKN